jgi:hypothetical protein
MRQADLCKFQNATQALSIFAHHGAAFSIVAVGNQITDYARLAIAFKTHLGLRADRPARCSLDGFAGRSGRDGGLSR